AGEELAAVLCVADREQGGCEDQRQRDVEAHPDAGLSHGGHVRALDDEEQIEEEDRDHRDARTDHEPQWERRFARRTAACGQGGGQDIHGCLSWLRRWLRVASLSPAVTTR